MDISDQRGDENYLLMSSPRRAFQGSLYSNLEMPGNRDEKNLEGRDKPPESSGRETSNSPEGDPRTPPLRGIESGILVGGKSFRETA